MNFNKKNLEKDPALKIVLVVVALSFILYFAGYGTGKIYYYYTH